MYITGDCWINPEAARKLIKLLQKNKKLTGSYGSNHYLKIDGVHYFNGEPFYEDGVEYFEGEIDHIKVMSSQEKVVDHALSFIVHMEEVRFEDPKPATFLCQCGKKIDKKKWHWIVNREAMCDKCYHTKWCEPFKVKGVKNNANASTTRV